MTASTRFFASREEMEIYLIKCSTNSYPTIRQRALTIRDCELDHLVPFKRISSIIVKNYFFYILDIGGFLVTSVRKFSDDKYRNFITVNYRTTC